MGVKFAGSGFMCRNPSYFLWLLLRSLFIFGDIIKGCMGDIEVIIVLAGIVNGRGAMVFFALPNRLRRVVPVPKRGLEIKVGYTLHIDIPRQPDRPVQEYCC
jgi:hypothetical protein